MVQIEYQIGTRGDLSASDAFNLSCKNSSLYNRLLSLPLTTLYEVALRMPIVAILRPFLRHSFVFISF